MPDAYVLSYFTTAEESLHLAISLDGRTFVAVDSGQPILRPESGTMRDPFIGIGPDGRFHLIATDSWDSTSLVHTASDDLLHWDAQNHLTLMGPDALNCWAPEFVLESDTGRARIVWSSVVDPHPIDGPQAHLPWNLRRQAIWTSTTDDFRSASAAELYLDPGYSVIDASLLSDQGDVYLAFKDERGEPEIDGEHNRIHLSVRGRGAAAAARELGPITPSPTEGPSLYRRGDELVMIFDHYLEEGRYGAVVSRDGIVWEPEEVTVPDGIRHAAVMTVDAEHPAMIGLRARTAEPIR